MDNKGFRPAANRPIAGRSALRRIESLGNVKSSVFIDEKEAATTLRCTGSIPVKQSIEKEQEYTEADVRAPKDSFSRGAALLSAGTGHGAIESSVVGDAAIGCAAEDSTEYWSGGLDETARRQSAFRTARGGEVSVSEEALRRGAALLSAGTGHGAIDSSVVRDVAIGCAAEASTQYRSGGLDETARRQSSFRTARGGEVGVSEEALRRGAALLSAGTGHGVMESSVVGDVAIGCAAGASTQYRSGGLDATALVPLSRMVMDQPVHVGKETKQDDTLAFTNCNFPVESRFNIYGTRNFMLSTKCSEEIDSRRDDFLDLSLGFLKRCPLSKVDESTLNLEIRTQRIAQLQLIDSGNASDVIFNTIGGIQFKRNGLLSEIVQRLPSAKSCEVQSWIAFQIKWIIWTLASFERRYPNIYLGKLLRQETLLKLISINYIAHDRDYISSHDSGASKRLKTGGRKQSPLQHCCDITTLIWPLCVCIALGNNECMITDGRWWTLTRLDSKLTALVKQVDSFHIP